MQGRDCAFVCEFSWRNPIKILSKLQHCHTIHASNDIHHWYVRTLLCSDMERQTAVRIIAKCIYNCCFFFFSFIAKQTNEILICFVFFYYFSIYFLLRTRRAVCVLVPFSFERRETKRAILFCISNMKGVNAQKTNFFHIHYIVVSFGNDVNWNGKLIIYYYFFGSRLLG
jgi:hypothetical protein